MTSVEGQRKMWNTLYSRFPVSCRACGGYIAMINFEEELKKFHPSLEG